MIYEVVDETDASRYTIPEISREIDRGTVTEADTIYAKNNILDQMYEHDDNTVLVNVSPHYKPVTNKTTKTHQPLISEVQTMSEITVPVTNASSPKKMAAIGPAVSFTPTDTQRFYDKSVLATLCTKAIPEMYSIPTRTQMKARICRLDWVLNYIQNGTVSKHASTSYDASLPFDKDQSLYGWQSVPLDIEGNNLVNLNSSYHTQSLTQVLLGQMPIRVHATKECDDF